MKILNLYSGIGGNRKLWGDDHEITAVEYDEKIAKIYQDFFPKDKVIVADAHQFLLDNYKEFDFIWSSPPCPTHSDIRRCGVSAGLCQALYPEMRLYQEIILLKHFAKGHWVIENVKPYYEPLIIPDAILHRHYFWTNMKIPKLDITDDRKHKQIKGTGTTYGFNLTGYSGIDKIKTLRNCVFPELGLHILNQALGIKTKTEQLYLF